MTPAELLDQVTSTVGYLRIAARKDADTELEWLRCGELVTDGATLLAVVRSTAAGRGTDRDDIAVSLFAQAYAFRIASTAIGGWLLSDGGCVFDVRPANTAIALGRHRPNAVALNHAKFRAEPVQSLLFDQHLTPFVRTAHEIMNSEGGDRVGEKLLWGNIATGCAAAFGAFHGAATDENDRASIRDRASAFFDDAPDEVTAAGQYTVFEGERSEPGWFWERNSCCLWNQIPPADPDGTAFMCEDCSLWSDDERQTRYLAATAAEPTSGGAS